jgi:hypothetical protein
VYRVFIRWAVFEKATNLFELHAKAGCVGAVRIKIKCCIAWWWLHEPKHIATLYNQINSDMHSGMWVSYLMFVFVVFDGSAVRYIYIVQCTISTVPTVVSDKMATRLLATRKHRWRHHACCGSTRSGSARHGTQEPSYVVVVSLVAWRADCCLATRNNIRNSTVACVYSVAGCVTLQYTSQYVCVCVFVLPTIYE